MSDAKKNDEPKKSKEAKFFAAMGDEVVRQRKQLTEDKGVEGTDLGTLELLALRSDYNKFEKECVPQLTAGSECTTVFNTRSGKRLDVTVSLQSGVDVNITSDQGASRKVAFRPPPPGSTL